MAEPTYRRPRLSVEVSDELHKALEQHFPWGQKTAAVNNILEWVMRLIERDKSIRGLFLNNVDNRDIFRYLYDFDVEDVAEAQRGEHGND